MIVTDQKISETTPKTLSWATLTGCGSLGSNSVCNVYSGLVPMSPKTTPSAPSASAPCAAARRLTTAMPASRLQLPRATLEERSPNGRDDRPGGRSGHLDPVAGGRDTVAVDGEQHVVAGRHDVGVGGHGDVQGAGARSGEVDRDRAGVDVGD